MRPTVTREPLWGVSDVAEFLGVPVKTVYMWRYQRTGPPAVRVGRFLKYRPSAVEQWLEDREREDARRPGTDM
jgi:predicted DNA-binding transcriptional regulator AlpA